MPGDAIESLSSETIRVGALSVRFLVEAADSNGSASVFECVVPADSKMPAPHSHDAFDETIYGLKRCHDLERCRSDAPDSPWGGCLHTSRRGPRVREPR